MSAQIVRSVNAIGLKTDLFHHIILTLCEIIFSISRSFRSLGKFQGRSIDFRRFPVDTGYLIYEYLQGFKDVCRLSMTCTNLAHCVADGWLRPVTSLKYMARHSEIVWVIRQCPALTCLTTHECRSTDISDQTLLEIGNQCKNLDHFEVVSNRAVTGEGILSVVQANKNLRYLDIHGTSPSNHHMIQSAPNLMHLSFLDMRNCDLLKSSGVVKIAENCKRLQYFNISNCDLVDCEGINAIAKHCSKCLEEIFANRCQKVSNEAFLNLFKACGNLKVVGVSRTQAGDSAIVELAKHSPNLNELDVSHNDDVTNEAVVALACNTKNLSILNVSWCMGVSDEGICALAEGCRQLYQLHVRECFFVTGISCGLISEMSPNCMIFDF